MFGMRKKSFDVTSRWLKICVDSLAMLIDTAHEFYRQTYAVVSLAFVQRRAISSCGRI